MSLQDQDTVILLVDELCKIKSYVDTDMDECDLGLHISGTLASHHWLTVEHDIVQGERFNVLASDCTLEDIELLIVGHLDTVRPSLDCKIELGSIQGDRYYNLGAGDTKGGIAATLDAIRLAGPTKGVGYLFYVDEEYDFLGMDAFMRDRADQIRPKLALSVCGGNGVMLTACRGCLEMAFTVKGFPGHASRPDSGASATEAMMVISAACKKLCDRARQIPGSLLTSYNVGGFYAGSLADKELAMRGEYAKAVKTAPNKIPDFAWMVIDVRPGHASVTLDALEAAARHALQCFNANKKHTASLQIHRRQNRGMYQSARDDVRLIETAFEAVHGSHCQSPGEFGYIDAAEIANRHGTALVCMAPSCGNIHSPDEWVNIPGLIAYRDGCVNLLRKFTAPK